jgi:deoxyribodipyrimidine photo-lyase
MQVHWHRRDLRRHDNHGLALAAGQTGDRGGPALPLFVFDDDVLAHGSPVRVRFMLDALAALREDYRAVGSDLLVRRGDPREVVPAVADEFGAERVTWNRQYSGLARDRDAAVRRALDDAGVARESVHDAVHHEPGSITTNDGEPYSVFTYFGRKWHDREKAAPYPAPSGDDLVAADEVGDAGALPSVDDLGFDEPAATVPEAGTAAARERLTAFCDGPIYEYDEAREYPARDGTSGLSPHLAWGTIGVREVYDAAAEARAGVEGDADEAAKEFQEQLAWREFYTQVLFHNPEVVSENYKEYENPIAWRDDDEALRAWKAGETGYPIVDAGMRQLRREAWMHNRVRMIVASFLTKDLLIDWREGYDWFRRKLVDHDTANNNGGWQWAASTGTDAQPYFRIFNPMTQGERYDPDGEYVREYVPELRGVDAETIHSWHELDDAERTAAAPDYPAPIVDHAERREAALAMFERARGDD